MVSFIMFFRRGYKYVFAVAAIGLLLFLALAPSSNAAELTPLEKTQFAAISSRFETLKRMVEILTRSLFGGSFAEVSGAYQCSDGVDNDGDLLIDYPNDSGCYSSTDTTETSDGGTSTSSSCSSSLSALLGSGCHYMYNDSSARAIYCDGPMTKSAKEGDTATAAGCSSSGTTPSTSYSSCTSGLIALLGDGCHQMYTDSSGSLVYCDGPMTKSAKAGDTATAAGCSSSSTPATTLNTVNDLRGTHRSSSNDVELSWTDNSIGEDEYRVWKRTAGGGWNSLASKVRPYSDGGTITYYDAATFAPNTTYEYIIKACTSSGSCAANDSNIAFITIVAAADTTSPSIPTGLAVNAPASSRTELAWAAATDNVGVTGYRIFRNNVSLTTVGAVINYTDATVVGATTYSYWVSAMDAAGNESPPGSLVSVTTPSTGGTTGALPPAPAGLSASLGTAGSVNLTWVDVTGETEYKMYRRLSPSGTWNTVHPPTASLAANVTVYTDSSLLAGTYEYRVHACNSAGCSGDSNVVIITVSTGGTTANTIPAAPSNVTAVQSSADALLTWYDNATNENEYKIERRPAGGTSWFTMGSTGIVYGGTGTYRDYLPPSASYDYRVKACNAVGCSGESNVALLYISSATTATTCSQYGSGWHTMDSSGTCFDPSMNNYRTANGTLYSCTATPAYGCSGGSTTTSSCGSSLIALLGSGCHNMYSGTGDGRGPVYCDGPMTKSAREGDTTATTGCTGSNSTATSPSGQKEQIWNSFGLRSWIRTDADPARIESLKQTCGTVSSGANIWLPGAGNSTSVDFGMPSAEKCRVAITCASSQYFDGASCVASGTYTGGGATTTYAGDATSCPGFSYSTWDSTGRRYCRLNTTVSCSYDYPAYLTQDNYSSALCPTSPSIGTYATSTYATSTYATTCSQYGSGWHTMDSSGTCFDPSMNNYRTANGTLYACATTPTSGCSSYTVEARNTSCDSALTNLLGSGCHQMYTDSLGNPIFCDGNMTRSAKRGDTATTAGCQSGGNTQTTYLSVDPYSTYPREGERGVNNLARIHVQLTKEIDLASTVAQFFSLTAISTPNSFLNGSFQFLGNGFDFMPSAPLLPNTTYVYKVFTTLKDRGGSNLSNAFSATFGTGGEGTSQTATIEGAVKDAGGQPVLNAAVHVSQENFSYNFDAVTGAGGAFQVTVPAGNYVIEVFPPSDKKDLSRPYPVKVTVLAGTKQTVNIQFGGLPKAISGSVKFSGGEPVPDAEVGAYSLESYQWKSVLADASGNYTLRLGGGKWTVGVRPQNPATAKWSFPGPFSEVSFTRDGSSGFQPIDFTVFLRDATLQVFALDAEDKPLADVGVVVDTLGAGQGLVQTGTSGSSPLSSPLFRTTNSSGIATFTLESGRYYVRAYLPPTRGYLNTPEKEVTVASGRSTDIRLVFKNRNAVTTIPFKGVVKLEDGTPTDAFVWAWSEKGGYVSTFSPASGLVEFKVGPNERWHIGAGKVLGNIPYKAPETVVEVRDTAVTVELILIKLEREKLPPPVVIKDEATRQIVAQAEDGAKAVVPPLAAGSSGNVSVEIKPTAEAPSQAAATAVSTVYDVSIRDNTGKSVSTFTSDVEITIPYDEAELKSKGVDESAVIPSFFDEKTGTWVKVDNFTIDKEKNVVIIRVNHLTRFGLVASTDTKAPSAPTKVQAVALGEGKVKISWQNPSGDFSYSKVYRSEKSGELGKIVIPQIAKSWFDDTNVMDGVLYYYTVRSVDPAGNESNNTNQGTVKAVGTVAKTPVSNVMKVTPTGQTAKVIVSKTLTLGSSGEEVKALQRLLSKEGVYPGGLVSGYFGNLTKKAVILFQEKYAKEILAPAGLTKGSGFVGAGTRKKLNELLAP